MQLLSVEIEGFGIFKNKQVINLGDVPKDAIIGIFGFNHDGAGYDSNGCGKSTFPNAITWCLFDRIPVQSEKANSLSSTSIINDDSDRARVLIRFLDEDEREIAFENTRTVKDDKSVNLWIDGEKYKANTDSQKRAKLFQILGIGGKNKVYFIDFLNHVYFTGEAVKGFASKNFSPKDRCDMVSRAKKLEVYDFAMKELNSIWKETKDLMSIKNSNLSLIETGLGSTSEDEILKRIRLVEQVIKDNNKEKDFITKDIENGLKYHETQTLVMKQEAKINAIKREIDKTLNEIESSAYILNQKVKESEEYKASILTFQNVKEDQLEETDQALAELTKEREILFQNEFSINNEIRRLKQENERLDNQDYMKCPSCSSDLINDGNCLHLVDINSLNEQHNLNTTSITNMNKSLFDIKQTLKIKDQDILDKKKQRDLLVSRLNQLDHFINQKAKIDNSIQYILTEKYETADIFRYEEVKNRYIINPEIKDYNNYEEIAVETEKLKLLNKELSKYDQSTYTMEDLNNISKQIDYNNSEVAGLQEKMNQIIESKQRINELRKEIKDLEAQFDMYKYWMQGYKYLKNIELNEIEPLLEEYTNLYLEKLGVGIEVTYKLIPEEGLLDLTLIEDSGKERELELFSKGQSTRISLSAGLALRELNKDSNIDFGFTMWDEVLDGLDTTGQERFFEILRDVTGMKLVISHDINLKNTFEHRLIVERIENSATINFEK